MDVNPNSSHFVVSSDFWKFIVVTIPMTVVTLGIVVILQAVWMRKHERVLEELKEKKRREAEAA